MTLGHRIVAPAIVAAALFLSARSASAQGAPATPPAPAQPPDPDQARIDEAMHLSDEGDKHFNLAEYDQAIAEYKEAYRIYDSPVFLYNLGQSYRLMGDCRNAKQMYANYLRLRPDDPNRPAIEARIEEMQTCIEKPPPREPPPDVPPVIVTPPVPVPAPVDDGGSPLRRRLGVGLVAGGAVALGVGIYFGLDARAADGEVSDRYASGGTWDDDIDAADARGRRSETLGVVFAGVGGALAIAGGVLWYLGRDDARPREATPAVTLQLRPGSRTAAVTWRF